MLLKRLYNLSEEQVEYQLRDRLSFLRFVQLGLGDSLPDSRTIWLYADQLAKAIGARELFEEFHRQLAERGWLIKEGVLVDATFVAIPRQFNSRDDNAKINEGETPAGWLKRPRKLAQQDLTARWGKKNSLTYYVYTNHVKVGAKQSLFVTSRRPTPVRTTVSRCLS